MKIRTMSFCALAGLMWCASAAVGFAQNPANSVFAVHTAGQTPAAPAPPITSRWDAEQQQTSRQEDIAAGAPADPALASVPCDLCAAEYCAPCLRLVASVEATFFWPQFNRDFLGTAFINDLGPVEIINNAAVGTAEGALMTAPRVTFGLQGECWGFMTRYWQGATYASTFTPALPDNTQSGVILFDTFRTYTVDFEVQRRFCWRYWDMVGFFGARYASADNDRSLWINNSFGDEIVTASGFAGQQFSGAGLTFGWFGTRPLFCDDGAWKLFYGTRYSVIFGNGQAVAQTNASLIDPDGEFYALDGGFAESDGDLFIMEVQFGVQWDACLKCLPANVFFRSGVEWQYWDTNAGVRVDAFSQAENQVTENLAVAATGAGDMLFRLIGFNIGFGLTY